jgi:cytochrome bd-type quinol oxidase subunit 2
MVFLIILGIVMMVGVAYLALSKKSEFKVRIAALGALALMIASVIVCFVIYLRTAAIPKQIILPDMMPSDMPAPAAKTNPVAMIMFIIFLIMLFVVIFIMAMREQKQFDSKEKPPPADDW